MELYMILIVLEVILKMWLIYFLNIFYKFYFKIVRFVCMFCGKLFVFFDILNIELYKKSLKIM